MSQHDEERAAERNLERAAQAFPVREGARSMTDEQINLLAETMCAGFHSDTPEAQEAFGGPVWEGLSTRQRGNWRRAARAAVRTLRGNMHWLEERAS